MMLLVQNGHGQMSSAPKKKSPESGPRIDVRTVDAILDEAQMVLCSGDRVLGDVLEGRLEAVAKDTSLPAATRARAMSLLCRSG